MGTDDIGTDKRGTTSTRRLIRRRTHSSRVEQRPRSTDWQVSGTPYLRDRSEAILRPRTEYSPQDDDFLCRYLASSHPDGSWHSRKTFQLLVSMTAEYPIAGRHSDQSWQERFKKNAAPFSRRVQRLVGEGVDRTLKTERERTKAATATVAAPARMQSPTVTASVPEDTKVAAS